MRWPEFPHAEIEPRPPPRRRQARVMGILPTFVSSGDVDRKKRDLKTLGDTVDAQVAACPNLEKGTLSAWGLFWNRVREFIAAESSFWSAAKEMDQAEQYERDLYSWASKIAKDGGCKNPLPDTPPAGPWELPGWVVPIVVGGIVVAFAFSPIGAAVGGAVLAVVERFRVSKGHG